MTDTIDYPGHTFRKSSYSSPRAPRYCVAVSIDDSVVRVIDSKAPNEMLCFTYAEWTAFLKGVKAGEFDLPENSE